MFIRIAVCIGAAAPLAGCRPAEPPELRFQTRDGYTIAADLHVPASETAAPLVVLGHELARDRHSWDPFVPRLLDAGYADVAVDHRGFGASTKEAPSPAELPEYARGRMGEDLLAAIEAAAKDPRVDASRVAVIGSGISTPAAVQCAIGNSAVRALVLFPGVLGAEEEDFLFTRPDFPLLLVAAAGDGRGVELLRQYGGRFSGPAQSFLEMQRVAPEDGAEWRGTEGFERDSGLADALLWFLARHFPGSGSS